MIEDAVLEKVMEDLGKINTKVTQLKNDMKQLSLAQNMAKEVEMNKLQQQVTMVCIQQHQREDMIEEL